MAPRKPRADARAKKSNDRVVKRPARGYQTYKNGMLNVTPKGNELARGNQASPLLALPPEIRSRIWHLALGGKNFRYEHISASHFSRLKLLPERSKRKHIFSLLRSCRQIYAEAALLPFTANTFSYKYNRLIGRRVKNLRKFQRSQIREVQFDVNAWELCDFQSQSRLTRISREMALTTWCPGLQHIHIRVFRDQSQVQEVAGFADCEAFIQSRVAAGFLDRGYKATTESMSLTLYDFHRQ